MRVPLNLLPLFAFASAAAVASGAAIMTLGGLGSGWTRNAIAWVAGMILALILSRTGRARIAPLIILAVTAFGIGMTFAAADIEGVHRWVDAGPLPINMAALLLPAAVVALARVSLSSTLGSVFAAIVALLLVAQPDASQASAFLIGVAIIAMREQIPAVRKAVTVAIAALAALAAWLRPDPLDPVIEVELIFQLAASLSLLLAGIAAIALAVSCLSPLAVADRPARTAGVALAGYFAAVAAAPLAGTFPVPLVGLGMSFPIGFWLGIGLLEALRTAPRNLR